MISNHLFCQKFSDQIIQVKILLKKNFQDVDQIEFRANKKIVNEKIKYFFFHIFWTKHILCIKKKPYEKRTLEEFLMHYHK